VPRLILMSATLDDSKFRAYFSLDPSLQPLPAPLVMLGQGKATPVQEYHWDKLARLLKDRYPVTQTDPAAFDQGNPCLSESAIKMCKVLIEKLDSLEEQEAARVVEARKKRRLPGAVLVFLPGLGEIKQVRDFLMAEEAGERRSGPEWCCIPLHSSIPWDEHEAIFDILPANQRKIILSTNIAESSLTVPDIRYVIDFCLTKKMEADPDTNYPRLVLDWASRSQLTQRKGRAGRVHHDGRVYRLIPLGLANTLPQDHKPEIQRVPLTKVQLDVKMLEMGSPKDLLALAMDPPRMRNIQRTVLDLKDLGALLTTVRGRQCRDDGDLTVLGEIVARLPVDVKLGKLIVFGHIFNVLEEAVIIASGLNGKSIFTSPFDKRVQAYKNKLHWADRTFSDCFAILLAYQTWDGHRRKGTFSGRDGVREREAVWCKESFLQRKQLLEMAEQVKEVTRNLAMMDIEPLQIQDPVCWEPEYKFTILRLVMFGAFYPNYFVKSTGSEVEARAHRTLLGRDPRNTVYLHGFDQDQAEFGELYAEQVKRIFRAATTDEEQIRVTFDKAHIFVEFNRSAGEQEKSMSSYSSGQADRNVTGDISSQVGGHCWIDLG
jgi:ATP-dependent RNA helicase TDRD9